MGRDRAGQLQGRIFAKVVPYLIIAGFVAVAFGYSVVVPPFETPDELYHYGFARHLALGNGLPVQTVEADGPWKHEGTQAPLYYMLLGRLIAPIDQSDFAQIAQINPRANLGDPLYPGNKNFMLYSTLTRPLAGTNLAVHIGRWFSIALSALALWFTWKIACLALPASRGAALLAVFIAAAIPQFAFVSASVSNDALVILVATAALYKMASLLQRDPESPITLVDWIVLGSLLGIAALSKLQGLGLFPLAGLLVAFLAWQRRSWTLLLHALVTLLMAVLLIAGWWYWRNFVLYGDFLAVTQLLEIEGLRVTPTTVSEFWGELRGLRYSFWGLFGWFSILLPHWIYVVLDIVTLLTGVGLLMAVRRVWRTSRFSDWFARSQRRVLALLALWGMLLIALMLYWLTFAISSQGRLLLPGIAAYSIAFVLGMGELLRYGADRWTALRPGEVGSSRSDAHLRTVGLPLYLLPIGLLLCSVYALWILLPGSYQAAGPIAAAPPSATAVNRVYGGVMELVAVEVPPGPFATGESVPVTLYLRKIADTDRNYELFVQLLDPAIKEIGNVTTHPGWGKNPTSLWEVGRLYQDPYEVAVLRTTVPDAPQRARLYVGFLDGDALLEVPGYDWDIDSRTVGYVLVQ